MVIRLDDQRFPCNSAHFRVAAHQKSLANMLHTCFVPPGECTAASLPFVTLSNRLSIQNNPCATAPLSLPGSDTVYGEYTESTPGADPADVAEFYPVGTVLMCPASVAPEVHASSLTPWFIVFKPCPVSLLRGAVPVGRVISCPARAERNIGNDIFDNALLNILTMRCEAKSCKSGIRDADISICPIISTDVFPREV